MKANLFTRSKARARGKLLWAGLLRGCGVLSLAKSWVRRRGIIVLTFHRVLRDSELARTASLPGMVVREQTFEQFLNHAADKYEFVDLSREPDWHSNARPRLAVTFDDGWSDNASTAFPIARKLGVPMLIFIATEKMGRALPFWPEQAASALDRFTVRHDIRHVERAIDNLKGLPAKERNQQIGLLIVEQSEPASASQVDTTLTWEQILQLHRDGVYFGSHSMTHEILTAIPLAQAEQEITGSRECMEQRLGIECRLFAYPNGDCSKEVRELVERAGYKNAFLNQNCGVWTAECNPYLIPRLNVCEYHFVDAEGNFSPLIFEYAVVWSAAKGLLAQRAMTLLKKLRRLMQLPTSRPA
jgi:peptidoglycan/xylan/chitin deacetylase (PgdA/CDA1 family)